MREREEWEGGERREASRTWCFASSLRSRSRRGKKRGK